jgi:hypothetical protein
VGNFERMAQASSSSADRFDELASIEEELLRLRADLSAMPEAVELEHRVRDLQERRDALRIAAGGPRRR